MNLSAVVLAGGHSSRMGKDKAFLEWKGRTLLSHQLETIRRLHPLEIFISGRASTDYQAFGYPILHDVFLERGPLAGIEQALSAASGTHVLVLAVDMPVITSEILMKLAGFCTDTKGVIPKIDGMLQPMAAIYPKPARSVALSMLKEKQGRVTQFAELCLQANLVQLYEGSLQDSPYFANWNSPADRPDFNLQNI